MTHLDALFLLVDRYRASQNIAEATLSTRLFSDGKRLGAIRAGSDVGVRRLNAALTWFSDNWPEGAEWPASVPRPQPSVKEPAE